MHTFRRALQEPKRRKPLPYVDKTLYSNLATELEVGIAQLLEECCEAQGMESFLSWDNYEEPIRVFSSMLSSLVFRDHFNKLNGTPVLGKKASLSMPKYRTAASSTIFDSKFLHGEGVVFHVYALVTSKTGKNLPGVSAGFTKRVTSIPKDLKNQLSDEATVAAGEAAEAGELWYIKVGSEKKGEGWLWTKVGGAGKVAVVQEVVQWLLKFKDQKVVDTSKAFYVEIANNILGE